MKYIISILFIVTGIKVCLSQNQESQTLISDKNYLEVFYPNYYYYYKFDNRFRASLPFLNIGFQYKHFNNNSFGIQASIASDYMRDLKSVDSFGQIAERIALYPSVGGQKTYSIGKKNKYISFGCDLSGRIGQLMTFGSSNEFETVFGTYEMLDLGISLESKLIYLIKDKYCLTLGLRHSFFALVYDKGADIYDIPSSPRNVTMLNLGLGFTKEKR